MIELLYVVDVHGNGRAMQRIEVFYDVGEIGEHRLHEVNCHPQVRPGDRVMRGDQVVLIVPF